MNTFFNRARRGEVRSGLPSWMEPLAAWLASKTVLEGESFLKEALTVAAAHVAAAEAFELKAAHRPGVWAKYAQTPGGSST